MLKKRIRFAYFPIRLNCSALPFTQKINIWVWWRNVVETQTLLEGWVAYIKDQDFYGESNGF